MADEEQEPRRRRRNTNGRQVLSYKLDLDKRQVRHFVHHKDHEDDIWAMDIGNFRATAREQIQILELILAQCDILTELEADGADELEVKRALLRYREEQNL